MLAAALAGATSQGATPRPEASPPVLPAFTTAASRLALEEMHTPFAVSRLEAGELAGSASGLADDLLRQIPGFSLFRRTSSLVAHPTTQGFSLRGIGPSGAGRSLILYDGAPLNDAFGGWVYWSRIDPARAGMIEVVRGGGSTAWGNGALGGVIQVVPRPIGDTGTEVDMHAGGLGTRRLSVAASHRQGPLGARLELRGFQTDGYVRVREDQRGLVDEPAGARHRAATLVVEHAPESPWFFRGHLGFFREKRKNGTPLTRNDSLAWRWQHLLEHDPGGDTRWQWNAYAERSRFASTFSSVNATRTGESLALDQFRVPSSTVGTALSRHHTFEDGRRLSLGADFRRVEGRTGERIAFSGAVRHAGGEQTFMGVFLEHSGDPSKPTVFSFGGRLDQWRNLAGFRDLELPGGGVNRERFQDVRKWVFSPRAGLTRQMGDQHRLKASAYRGFRAPTINELYRPFQVGADRTSANELLRLEIIHGVESAWAMDLGARGHSTFTAYWSEVTGAVANVTLESNPLGGVDRQRKNLGRTRVRGLEWEGARPLSNGVELYARYAWIDARVRRAPVQPALIGRQLAQTARHQGLAGLRGRHADGRWSWHAHLRFQGRQFEDDANTRVLGGFAVVDFSIRHRVRHGLEARLSVDNLLNRRFADGVTGDGLVTQGSPRLVSAGLDLEF